MAGEWSGLSTLICKSLKKDATLLLYHCIILQQVWNKHQPSNISVWNISHLIMLWNPWKPLITSGGTISPVPPLVSACPVRAKYKDIIYKVLWSGSVGDPQYSDFFFSRRKLYSFLLKRGQQIVRLCMASIFGVFGWKNTCHMCYVRTYCFSLLPSPLTLMMLRISCSWSYLNCSVKMNVAASNQ